MATAKVPVKTSQRLGANVKRGVKLLDKRGHKDWYKKINLTKLQMCNPYVCMLGQLYGNYIDGVYWLGVNTAHDKNSYDYGFIITAEMAAASSDWRGDATNAPEFAELNRLWKDVIRARRAAANQK